MAKSIKLMVVSVDGFSKALVKVVEQSNRCEAFGNCEGDKAWIAPNGIKLVSNVRPSRDKVKSLPNANIFYLQGSDTSKDDNCFAVSMQKLPKLIEAVKAYNFYYTPSEINKRVRAKRAAEERAEQARREAAYRAEQLRQRQAADAYRAEQLRQAQLLEQQRRAQQAAAQRQQNSCTFIVG